MSITGLDNRLIEPDNWVGSTLGALRCFQRLGGMLRFYTGHLASFRVYVQHMRIRLEPDDADNLMVAVGGSWHFGTR